MEATRLRVTLVTAFSLLAVVFVMTPNVRQLVTAQVSTTESSCERCSGVECDQNRVCYVNAQKKRTACARSGIDAARYGWMECGSENNEGPVCGNGTEESGEQCDDGNTENGDGCDSSCNIETGQVCSLCSEVECRTDTVCYANAQRNRTACARSGIDAARYGWMECGSENNEGSVCGNGTVEEGEDCDDGNVSSDDGCSSDCQNEQAILYVIQSKERPGTIEPGENYLKYFVTVANTSDILAQDVSVSIPIPQNLSIRQDKLDNNCLTEGANIVCTTSSGSPRNLSPGQSKRFTIAYTVPDDLACPHVVTHASTAMAYNAGTVTADPLSDQVVCPSPCGNGEVEPEKGEQCDDGNTENGDGCSSDCTEERKMGDVTNDGTVSGMDASAVTRHVKGIEQLSAENKEFADVDQNTIIDIADVYLISGKTVGLINLPAVYGDVTDDGSVSGMDASKISGYVSGSQSPSDQQRYLADVDVNGVLDQRDVNLVGNAVVGNVILPVLCGNGIVEDQWDEECDDGNTEDGDGCDSECLTESICGNGQVEKDEECDDGNTNSRDGCSPECMIESDIRISIIEQAPLIPGGKISIPMTVENIGPGIATLVHTSDSLPPGFTINPEYTHDSCRQNNDFDPPRYSCDFGTVYANTAQSVVVTFNVPADLDCENNVSIKATAFVYEDKNPQNNVATLSLPVECAPNCEPIICNDGRKFPTCEDGDSIDYYIDPCSAAGSVCGNGKVEAGEQCDDGNRNNGDGCTNNCEIEDDWMCEVGPSRCNPSESQATCGNRKIDSNEQCDDGNLISKDGCSVGCQIERGWSCTYECKEAQEQVSGIFGFFKTITAAIISMFTAEMPPYENCISVCDTECGDGIVAGDEECDPPSANTCDDQCKIIDEDETLKITSITNASSDPNGSVVPIGIAELGSFKFTAASTNQNKMVFRSIIFSLNATNVSLDAMQFRIFNISDPTMIGRCEAYSLASRIKITDIVSGSLLIACNNMDAIIDSDVNRGENIVLGLQGNVTDQNNSTVGAPSTLQVSLQSFNDSSLNNFGVGQGQSHIMWQGGDDGGDGDYEYVFTWIKYPDTIIKSTSYGCDVGQNGCDPDAAVILNIAVKEIGSGDIAVENEKDINLFRFEARGDEKQDLLLTSAAFLAMQGSLNNGQEYTLWVDTDNDRNVDTILDRVVNLNDRVIFNNLAGGGYVVSDNQSVFFEVHTDIASSLTGDMLQLQFDTGDSNYIKAEYLEDGASLEGGIETNGACNANSCDIIVQTVPSQPWTLVNQGDLYVSQSTVALQNRQLLGGELGEPILRLQFRAQNEDVEVTDIQLTSLGNPISNEVDRLELYIDGESNAFALATVGGCGSDDVPTEVAGNQVQTFCANMESRQLVIPEGAEVDVLVRPRIKTDVQGAVSGENVQIFVHKRNVSDEATGAGAIRARGDVSSNNLSANNEDALANGEIFIGTDSIGANGHITGNRNTVVMSKIISITNANEDPNGSSVPIGLSDIGKFKFTAANHLNSKNGNNHAVLSNIIFNLNATNVSLTNSDFRLYNEADSSTTHACTTLRSDGSSFSDEATGSFYVQCKDMDDSPTDTVIDASSSVIVVLQGNVTNQNSSSVGAPSVLQVSLQEFIDIDKNGVGIGNNNSHIMWGDTDTTVTTFTWIEYSIPVVKSTSYTG